LYLAEHFPIEIISIDSALIYKDMNIGTAKPSLLEMEKVPHHLINIIDPDSNYSVAQFIQDTKKIIRHIHSKGKIPVCVGGTMLYLRSLTQGLSELPSCNFETRKIIEQESLVKGWHKLHEELALIDPDIAKKINPNDAQRIQRALGIYKDTGKNMSYWLTSQPKTIDPEFNFYICSYEINHRAWLHERIEQRFKSMLENGFIDEVKALRAKYPSLTKETTSMRCVGYRQVWDFLDGNINMDTLLFQGISATRQLAKRQITWLKNHIHSDLRINPEYEDIKKLQLDAYKWMKEFL
jgi:tRNA dimethylallyltransferase